MLDGRWIDGVLWSCLLVMLLASLGLLWEMSAGATPWPMGDLAQGLVRP
ncbi:MAG: hypothetical protein KQH53_19235 [Desulfarculaceae bacterium]|nr:hypothetical protein [Desulfarculaceae bacterium]